MICWLFLSLVGVGMAGPGSSLPPSFTLGHPHLTCMELQLLSAHVLTHPGRLLVVFSPLSLSVF